ncbi:MAG: hypothetical protein EOM20_14045 [Spartobacteria bacterium]|nr:hypothetical protein [Spartobacteria bacterium]
MCAAIEETAFASKILLNEFRRGGLVPAVRRIPVTVIPNETIVIQERDFDGSSREYDGVTPAAHKPGRHNMAKAVLDPGEVTTWAGFHVDVCISAVWENAILKNTAFQTLPIQSFVFSGYDIYNPLRFISPTRPVRARSFVHRLTLTAAAFSSLSGVLFSPISTNTQSLREEREELSLPVDERVPEDYRAQPIRYRGFLIRPVLTLSSEYDTNVYAEERAETGGVIVKAQPGVSVLKHFNAHTVLAAQARQHDPYLLFRAELTAGLPLDVPDNPVRLVLVPSGIPAALFLSHLRLLRRLR